jgi:LPS O-antigen subunit length determinant protein (WzzB/FepE family)
MATGHDSELQTHQEMWRTFVRIIGYSAAAIMALLALMALFLL